MKAFRVIGTAARTWALLITGLVFAGPPSAYRAVGPLSPAQRHAIDSAWVLGSDMCRPLSLAAANAAAMLLLTRPD